tara:strand:+ start:571 stop:1008 length:438 start_codon:yes stop_codon:yes gene_type:complete
MNKKNDNLVFFGKNFVDKLEEPRSSAEEEFMYDWFNKLDDIFNDEHKRYFAINILNIMYYKEGWSEIEDQPNFLQSYLAEAEKRINNIFKNKAREHKIDRLKYLYQILKNNKKSKKFKIKRSKVKNLNCNKNSFVVPETEIIKLY